MGLKAPGADESVAFMGNDGFDGPVAVAFMGNGPTTGMTHGVHYRNERLGGVTGRTRCNGRHGFVSFQACLFFFRKTNYSGSHDDSICVYMLVFWSGLGC